MSKSNGVAARRFGRLTAGLAVVLAGLASLVAAPQALAAFGMVPGSLEASVSTTQAGAHPDGTTSFRMNLTPDPDFGMRSDGALKDVFVDLPPGIVGDPRAVARCSTGRLEDNDAATGFCPRDSMVGVIELKLTGFALAVLPIFNVEPPRGVPASFAFKVFNETIVRLDAELRSDGEYAVSVRARDQSARLMVESAEATLWGVPADRQGPGPNAFSPFQWLPFVFTPDGYVLGGYGGPLSGAERRPFLTNGTECHREGITRQTVTSWNAGNLPDSQDSPPTVLDGCQDVPFAPSMAVVPSSTAPDSASGLDVDLELAQDDDPDGLGSAHLKDVVMTLPEGFSVNPSGATGLDGCSDAEIGLDLTSGRPVFDLDDPFDGRGAECPEAAKIGTVTATTPLLEETISGDMVLGDPKSTDPQSGEMLRLFLVLRQRERGILVKVAGSAVADPATGRLTATFLRNPQFPVSELSVSVKGGERGMLATSPTCGERSTAAVFTPWTEANGGGGASVPLDSAFAVAGDCSRGFVPTLRAGMSDAAARGSGTFSFRFSRRDGEQYLRGLTATLPAGLLASVKGVPLCTDAQATAGACPEDSRIGVVDAAAGAGAPFVLERKGEVFLTEGYKGGAYGLLVKVRPVAGPFRDAMELSPILVRQAIHVDPATAQVRAVSDPFPQIWHGVPLRVREVTVSVDRDRFMVNPSSCSPKRIEAEILSADGATAGQSEHFQVDRCGALSFKPRLAMALTGRKQVRTGKHPGVKAVVRQRGVSEAGIEQAVVRLPKSLALDPDNAQALCEFEAGTKPDLEKHCPAGSIVGKARAVTPLLEKPLSGNVYFVKNVRKDPKTGNAIRTLPMIVVALRGEIAVNLRGESDTTRDGRLVNTFARVPDAPITRFDLKIAGGSNGILAVTRTRKSRINLCARPKSHVAEADMDGHNGKRRDFDVRMKAPCAKKTKQAGKTKRGKR